MLSVMGCALALSGVEGLWVLSFAQEPAGYDAKGKRNPFTPLVTPDGRLLKLEQQEKGSSDLRLEGIIYDKGGASYCILNGEVLKPGDSSGDYQLLKIEDGRIVLIKDGQALELELNKEGE